MMVHVSKDWKVWVYLTCGAVLGLTELYAATTGPSGDTISERVWSVSYPFGLLLGLGVMVLGIHFAFQGRKPEVQTTIITATVVAPEATYQQSADIKHESEGLGEENP